MMMRLTFVAIGLLGLSGCCSCAYFDDACTRPEESSASGLHCGRREEWPRAYMNITAKECGLIADDALGVLQVTFPVSHRPSASQNPSASQKAKEDI